MSDVQEQGVTGYRHLAALRPEDTGYIINDILTGDDNFPDFVAFLFRPTEIHTSCGVEEDKKAPMGQSHAYGSFNNTMNVRASFTLYMNALMMLKEMTVFRDRGFKEGGKRNIEKMADIIEEQRRFIWSLNYPALGADGIVGSDTPAVTLFIPKIITIRCKLTRCDEIVKETDHHGNIMELEMHVAFEERPMSRITMQDVLMNGLHRTWR